jgi:hypothetical protein
LINQAIALARRQIRSRSWCVVLLILQPILFFWRTLISKTTHIPWDLTGFHAPLVSVVVEGLKEGRIPLWDPYTYAGYPLHADIAVQLFYPPAWLVFFFGVIREEAIFYWLEWLVTLHIMLAGIGTYILLRRLSCRSGPAVFGATVFEMGCFFSSQPQHLGAVAGAAWMPFAWLGVVLLADGFSLRRFAMLAASLAMIFLAGFPAITLVGYGTTMMVAVAFAMLRKTPRILLNVLGAFVLAGLLSAVQLMPTLELSSNSAASQRWMWNEPGGVTPRAIIGAIWPDYLHVFTPSDKTKFTEPTNFTFLYFYNGQVAAWLTLFALFLGRGPARIFAGVAVISLLVLCGGAIPGYALAYRSLPKLVRSAIYVEFTLAAFSLSAAVAAALVLNRLSVRHDKSAITIALATGLELLMISSNRPMNAGEGGWKGHDSTKQMMHQPGLLARVRRLVYESDPPYRTDTAEWSPRFTSSAPLLRLPSANGDNPFAPLRMLAYRGIYARVTPWERQYPIQQFESPLIAAANVGFIMHNGAPLDDLRMRSAGWSRVPIASERPLSVYRNLRVLPRYRLVESVQPVRDMHQALTMLPNVDLRTTAVVESSLSLPSPSTNPPGQVTAVEYSPEQVDLVVDTKRPSYLVVTEGYAPGWKASVDGRPATIFATNVAFMGLPISQGKHHVRLFYRPVSLFWGAGISVFAWLCVVAFCARRHA